MSEDPNLISDLLLNSTFESKMSSNPPPFSSRDRIRVLLWSDRHCCLCGRACDTNIEIHHIRQEGENISHIDNAIPLCFDCHGRVKSYSAGHPVGTSYAETELKRRRDQIYDARTQHLVPLVEFNVDQGTPHDPRPLPTVRTMLAHRGVVLLPVRVLVEVKHILAGKELGLLEDPNGYYSGRTPWNLNPGVEIHGNFGTPEECVETDADLKMEERITLIDRYERPHMLLPQAWTFVRPRSLDNAPGNYWFLEPRSFTEWDTKPAFLTANGL